jgi:Fe2+ transport system protein B
MDDLVLEKALYMFLELNENIKDIRLALNKIQPSKATISINETDIIFVTTDRSFSRTPHI